MAKKQNNAPEIELVENSAVQPTKETLAINAAADFMNAIKALKDAHAKLSEAYNAQPINERQLLGAALSKVYTAAEMRLIQNANLAAIIKQM